MKDDNLPLSYDGCGINDRDAYASRIATFTHRGDENCRKYGPLFAASPVLLAALRNAVYGDTLSDIRIVLRREGHPDAARMLEQIETQARHAIKLAGG
jgi:hypothetical protein